MVYRLGVEKDRWDVMFSHVSSNQRLLDVIEELGPWDRLDKLFCVWYMAFQCELWTGSLLVCEYFTAKFTILLSRTDIHTRKNGGYTHTSLVP